MKKYLPSPGLIILVFLILIAGYFLNDYKYPSMLMGADFINSSLIYKFIPLIVLVALIVIGAIILAYILNNYEEWRKK